MLAQEWRGFVWEVGRPWLPSPVGHGALLLDEPAACLHSHPICRLCRIYDSLVHPLDEPGSYRKLGKVESRAVARWTRVFQNCPGLPRFRDLSKVVKGLTGLAPGRRGLDRKLSLRAGSGGFRVWLRGHSPLYGDRQGPFATPAAGV